MSECIDKTYPIDHVAQHRRYWPDAAPDPGKAYRKGIAPYIPDDSDE